MLFFGVSLGVSFGVFTPNPNSNNYLTGLVKLLRAVPSVKRFYWVVPALIFEDFKKQRFVNKDSEPWIRAMSNSVSGVEQWALELPLNYFHPGAVQS